MRPLTSDQCCCESDLLARRLRITHAIIAGSHHKGDRGATAAAFNSATAKDRQALLVDAKAGGRGAPGSSQAVRATPLTVEDLQDSTSRELRGSSCLSPSGTQVRIARVVRRARSLSTAADLEMQAAKRCHRLGQTRKVDLSILVIADSFEDALLKRRGQLTSRGEWRRSRRPWGRRSRFWDRLFSDEGASRGSPASRTVAGRQVPQAIRRPSRPDDHDAPSHRRPAPLPRCVATQRSAQASSRFDGSWIDPEAEEGGSFCRWNAVGEEGNDLLRGGAGRTRLEERNAVSTLMPSFAAPSASARESRGPKLESDALGS